MFRQLISRPPLIAVVLILQFIPLILFPASSFSPSSQEWWLPGVLMVLSIIAVIALFVNRSVVAGWAWQLIAFAQGFNLISRILLLFPHMTTVDNNVQTFNTPYVILTFLSIAMSVFMLWFVELPEVRAGLYKEKSVS